MKSTFKKCIICVIATILALSLSMPPSTAEESLDELNRHWVGTIWDEYYATLEEETVINTLDRTKPIYEVYKGGYQVYVPVEWQWYIRDLCEEHDLPERTIYGLILEESTFVANCKNTTGDCFGLSQLSKHWIRTANITHFTDDYRSRDLYNPYDNILTLAELMCYARTTYGLDYGQRDGLVKYLYFHNTGKDPTRVRKWDYATRALGYADELVTLQS